MATTLLFYSDAALTTSLSNKNISHLLDGSGDPQDFLFYVGSITANKFRNSTSPGVAQLACSIENATALWTANTAKVVNNTVRTTAKNGYRYKVQSIAGTGTTGATEPAWPTTVGATVTDNPGANQVVWINDGKLHEATEIKLATTSGGLASATAGASLNLGTLISGGSANAVPIYMRIDDATAVIGSVTELSLTIKNVEETPT